MRSQPPSDSSRNSRILPALAAHPTGLGRLPHPDLADKPWGKQYAHAFFWAVEITTGMGDDITPKEVHEILYTSVATLIGIIMYAIILGNITSALQDADKQGRERKEFMDRIREMLKFRGVPQFFQIIVLDYYRHMLDNPSNDDLLAELPDTLRLRLSLVLNRDLIEKIPIFKKLSADSFIRVVQRLQSAT